MSQTAGSYIYTGPWINWSHGLVLGSTITLSERDGGLLTAFLAIFVSAAGVAFWRLTSYALHQYRASQDPRDGLHHQQQAIFRNNGSPGGAAYQFIQLVWYWRKNAVKPLMRSLPFALLAFMNLILFGVAGIFSSEVTKAAGNETVIRSSSCGQLGLSSGLDVTKQSQAAFNSLDLNDTLSATTYSRACYSNTQNVLQCNQYAVQDLPWKVNQNASCPFSPGICLLGATAAYEMDSGLIDSHHDLGINAPQSERVQYRKVTTCSPIHTKGYATEFNDTTPTDLAYGDTFERLFYGPIVGVSNYSYAYNTHELVDNNGYYLESLESYAGAADDTWLPIPELNRTDADVSIFLLAQNSILYQEPVTDPFFAATTPYALPSVGQATNITYYQADEFVNALACTDQHQFCNPNTKECTPLTGSLLIPKEVPSLKLNNAQFTTTIRLEYSLLFLNTYASVHSRGANALRAFETVDDNTQIAILPNNQWMTEVSNWFAVSMAKLQQRVVSYATGPAWIPDGVVLSGPINDMEKRMCRNQKVRTPSGTTSFSVLGVAIILLVGALLVITNLTLDIIIGFWRKRFQKNDYKRLQWILDDKLQLQRLAYEEAGQGQWSGGTDAVPVTRMGEAFGMPHGVDPMHPRLSQAWGQTQGVTTAAPEAQGLMSQKGIAYNIQDVGTENRY